MKIYQWLICFRKILMSKQRPHMWTIRFHQLNHSYCVHSMGLLLLILNLVHHTHSYNGKFYLMIVTFKFWLLNIFCFHVQQLALLADKLDTLAKHYLINLPMVILGFKIYFSELIGLNHTELELRGSYLKLNNFNSLWIVPDE